MFSAWSTAEERREVSCLPRVSLPGSRSVQSGARPLTKWREPPGTGPQERAQLCAFLPNSVLGEAHEQQQLGHRESIYTMGTDEHYNPGSVVCVVVCCRFEEPVYRHTSGHRLWNQQSPNQNVQQSYLARIWVLPGLVFKERFLAPCLRRCWLSSSGVEPGGLFLKLPTWFWEAVQAWESVGSIGDSPPCLHIGNTWELFTPVSATLLAKLKQSGVWGLGIGVLKAPQVLVFCSQA